MKKHIILAGTAIATVALCWALCGGTTTVDTIPTPATESAVSAPCAPQTRPTEPSSNIIITEPVTQPETVPVTGSVTSPAQDGMVYVPGFGYLQSEGPGEWSVSENMYENGNKVGIMG